MANGNQADDRDPKFNFGTRELREARRAQSLTILHSPPASLLK